MPPENEIDKLEIHQNFPYCYDDNTLIEKIKELSYKIAVTENQVLVKKAAAFAQIGLNELNNRQLKKQISFFKEQSEQNTITTKKSFELSENGLTISKHSLTFSKFGFLFSILAVILSATSVYFAYRDDAADTQWQEMQRTLLEKSINEQTKSNQYLDSLLQHNKLVKNGTTNNQSSNTQNNTR